MNLRTAITCASAFIAGVAALFLALMLLSRRGQRRTASKKHSALPKKKLGTMDVILMIVGVALTAFTIEMIQIFKATGTEPSTLETCVFAALGGECGVMGWIRTNKDRYREREWQQEDAKPPNVPPVDDFPTNNL